MQQILDTINGNTQYIFAIVIISILAMAVTFVVNMMSKKLAFLKYIPGLVLIFAGIFSLLMVLNNLFARASLNNLIISLIGLTSGACAILFAMCLGIYNKDVYNTKKLKNQRKPEEARTR